MHSVSTQEFQKQDSFSMEPHMNTQMPQMATPNFFIYRAATPGESFDPTAAIQFWPAKDSDELFDALRMAYPLAKTHSERMRDAVIDFLVKERDMEQARTAMTSTPSTWSQSWPSHSSSSSNLSSPDLIDLATPASVASPMPTLSRQPSKSSAGRSSMEQMTGVFSLSSNSHTRSHIRRKMTDTEKAEYRKRRLVRACDQCQKRKRKCVHNQEQMEVALPGTSGKVTKRKPSQSGILSFHQAERTPPPSSIFELDNMSFNLDEPLFPMETQQGVSADANLNLLDLDFSETATAGAWPWSSTQDWTLIDAQPTYSAAQSEPLFGEISYANQATPSHHRQDLSAGVRSEGVSTERQPSTHTFQVPTTLSPSSIMQSPFLDMTEFLQESHNAHNEGVSAGYVPSASYGRPQPTRSVRHHGGFAQNALPSASQDGMTSTNVIGAAQPAHAVHQAQAPHSGQFTTHFVAEGGDTDRPSRTLGGYPTGTASSDIQAFSDGAGTPSRNARHGFIANDVIAASHSMSQALSQVGSIRDDYGEGHQYMDGGISTAARHISSVVKNKGPEHAIRSSAGMAGRAGTSSSLPTEAHVAQGDDNTTSPCERLNLRHQPESHGVLAGVQQSPNLGAGLERPVSTVFGPSHREHGHASSTFARGVLSDFDKSRLSTSSSGLTSSTDAIMSTLEKGTKQSSTPAQPRSHSLQTVPGRESLTAMSSSVPSVTAGQAQALFANNMVSNVSSDPLRASMRSESVFAPTAMNSKPNRGLSLSSSTTSSGHHALEGLATMNVGRGKDHSSSAIASTEAVEMLSLADSTQMSDSSPGSVGVSDQASSATGATSTPHEARSVHRQGPQCASNSAADAGAQTDKPSGPQYRVPLPTEVASDDDRSSSAGQSLPLAVFTDQTARGSARPSSITRNEASDIDTFDRRRPRTEHEAQLDDQEQDQSQSDKQQALVCPLQPSHGRGSFLSGSLSSTNNTVAGISAHSVFEVQGTAGSAAALAALGALSSGYLVELASVLTTELLKFTSRQEQKRSPYLGAGRLDRGSMQQMVSCV